MKPDLTMYVGRKVTSISRDPSNPANWGIMLDNGVLIQNQSPAETISPGDEIIGSTVGPVIHSLRDTTVVLTAANGHTHKLSLAPTYYTISDPRYGGIVYPQWPEELEEGGVPATPEGGISEKPQADWDKAEEEIHARAQARREQEAAHWLKEDEDESAD